VKSQEQGPQTPDFGSCDLPAAVAADCDETLTSHGRLLPSVLLARTQLERLGIPLVIVTGRAAGFAWTAFELLHADAVVAENGGVLFERTHPEEPIWLNGHEGTEASPSDTPSATKGSQARSPGGWQRGREIFEELKSLDLVPATTQPTLDCAFRFTDFTFPLTGLSPSDLQTLNAAVTSRGASFVFSTIHAHIMPNGQNKARGVLAWARRHNVPVDKILTIGDSPNDAPLFDPQHFAHTWGVAGAARYFDVMASKPRHMTKHDGGQGFAEMVCRVTNQPDMLRRWLAIDGGWDHIVFIDGACALCSAFGRRLLGPGGLPEHWSVSTLQGTTAAHLLGAVAKPDTVGTTARPAALVVWTNGGILTGADAVCAIAEAYGGWERYLAKLCGALPSFLKRGVYALVARSRFALFPGPPQPWGELTSQTAHRRILP
jgi:HAD superfamily hydrolase (TIGR01484 family)